MSPRPLDDSQSVVDGVVTEWPDVTAKNVFGHRGWLRSGRMFGFAADEGVAVKLTETIDAGGVVSRDGVALFAPDGQPMKNWAVLPVRSEVEVDDAIGLLRTAYEDLGA